MHEFLIALVGGAIGSLLTLLARFWSRFRRAPGEVAITDRLVAEHDEDLASWVSDEHLAFKRRYKALVEDLNKRGLLNSGHAGLELGLAKEETLHRYRDEERRVLRAVATLREKETGLHDAYRRRAHRPFPTLATPQASQPVLDAWRKPVTRHLSPTDTPADIDDPSRRNLTDALADVAMNPNTFT